MRKAVKCCELAAERKQSDNGWEGSAAMVNSDFETTWYPRTGKDAAEELRRYRRTALLGLPIAVSALGAGVLIGTGTLGDVIGGVLAIACVVLVGMFSRAQWRTAAAVSVWFGVKQMRWLPRMTPQRFDEWRQLRGLMTPEERAAASGPRREEENQKMRICSVFV
jgi:hypothetical protein